MRIDTIMKRYFFFSFLFFLALGAIAQPGGGIGGPIAPDSAPYATMEQDNILRSKFPELGTLGDFEHAIKLKIEEIEALRKSGRVTAATISMPVIVHVVHNG